jgi:hypothetical protein
MSSFVRRLQVRMLRQRKVEKVPVRDDDTGKTVGFRYPLHRSHAGYVALTGAPILAPKAKPKRVRKPRTAAAA